MALGYVCTTLGAAAVSQTQYGQWGPLVLTTALLTSALQGLTARFLQVINNTHSDMLTGHQSAAP